jgi:hypothetical protein
MNSYLIKMGSLAMLKDISQAYSRDSCTPMIIAALFKIAILWN